MAILHYLCWIVVSSLLHVSQASECPSINHIYEDMGCQPVFDDKNEAKCPVKYDCSKLRKTSEKQCFLNGKFFNLNDRIPSEDTEDNCRFACRCTDRLMPIHCAAFDCPFQRLAKGCQYSYGFNCCPEKIICKSDKSLTSCSYNNKTYLEGASFSPEPCTRCVCQKGFDGKLEEPFCKKMKCFADDEYYNAILKDCAPIYFKDNCCPVAFTCANGDEIVMGSSRAVTENKCLFGGKSLNIGDEAEVKVPAKAKCTCITPPLVTCTSNESYLVFASL